MLFISKTAIKKLCFKTVSKLLNAIYKINIFSVLSYVLRSVSSLSIASLELRQANSLSNLQSAQPAQPKIKGAAPHSGQNHSYE